jgi:hypothetical protein
MTTPDERDAAREARRAALLDNLAARGIIKPEDYADPEPEPEPEPVHEWVPGQIGLPDIVFRGSMGSGWDYPFA